MSKQLSILFCVKFIRLLLYFFFLFLLLYYLLLLDIRIYTEDTFIHTEISENIKKFKRQFKYNATIFHSLFIVYIHNDDFIIREFVEYACREQ